MSKEQQSKTIDGHTFCVTPLMGRRGARVFARLVRCLGKGFSTAMKAKTDEERAGGVLELLSNITEDDLEFLSTQLLETATVETPDGKTRQISSVVFDEVFQGEVFLMLKAVLFAVQVNGFLKGLASSALAGPKPVAPAQAPA